MPAPNLPQPVAVHFVTTGADPGGGIGAVVESREGLPAIKAPIYPAHYIYGCGTLDDLATFPVWASDNLAPGEYVEVIEFLFHGGGASPSGQAAPPVLYFGDTKVVREDLVKMAFLVNATEIAQHRARAKRPVKYMLHTVLSRTRWFLLSACAAGADTPDHLRFRTELCRLLFGMSVDPTLPNRVEVRSSAVDVRAVVLPRFVPTQKLVIEDFYRTHGELLRSRRTDLKENLLGSPGKWVP